MSRLHRTAAIPPMPDLLPPAPEDGPSLAPALLPALPQPSPGPIITPPLRSVRAGCWLLNYRPSGAALASYDGTVRVESHSGGNQHFGTAAAPYCRTAVHEFGHVMGHSHNGSGYHRRGARRLAASSTHTAGEPGWPS